MASSSSSSSSSFSRSSPPKYDVFLSFRGEDTRNNFTSYLYDALCRKQIETFINNHELRRGDEISSSLSKAIKDSILSIIIFSENYASSSWCLNELLEILECKKKRQQIILPVFYHVSPSDVRQQMGTYKIAFTQHEKRFKKTDKVRNWRAALTEAANLSGWDLNEHDGTESEFVENIAKDVSEKLNHISSSDYLDGLVGIASPMECIESLLCIGTKNIVRTIGIWGMGGIGKTTIAKAIFNRLANQFEGHCFLTNVRDLAKYGPNHVQEKLLLEIFEDQSSNISAFTLNRLRRKKVLIIFDDVDDLDHLDIFMRSHSSFGVGSRIIITSRDKQVLKNCVDDLYELKELNYHEAIQLFSANAFKQNHPPEDYMELSNRAIRFAKGNPLALKVLGCFLYDKSKLEWKSSLNKLKKFPNLKIQNVLRISYDGLDYQEKEIFLSIACFFKEWYKDRVIAILDNCRLFTEIGIAVLVDKCLLTVTHNLLRMHDLIQEMGHAIVLQESFNEPGKRSRLWDPQDISNVFKENTGTNVVESISLDLSQIRELHLSHDAFMRMQRLKFLKFYSSQSEQGNYEQDEVDLCQGLESFPNELRYLHWHRYPLKSLPSKFKAKHLVELEMPHSNLEQLWMENKLHENLKRIDLSYCQYLTEAPNVSQVPNLQVMMLHGCSVLSKFPKIPCNIRELYLSHTAIEEIPSAIESLNKLETLKLENCTMLKNLPRSIRHLTSLIELNLRGCSSITEFPEISGNVESLLLGETAIEEVPSSIKHLTKLSRLSLNNCTRLRSVSNSIFRLKLMSDLFLGACSKLDNLSIDEEVSSSTELLPQLSVLHMEYCKNIESFPIAICNLTSLYSLNLSGYPGTGKLLENLPSEGLRSLQYLTLIECNLLVLPSALNHLPSLISLNLSGNNFEILNLKPFSSLLDLKINNCERLRFFQEFPLPSRLLHLEAYHCISLEKFPTSNVVFTGNCNSRQSFQYSNCFNLDENARTNILADAWLRSRFMASNAQKHDPMKDRLVSSVSICLPGSDIPEWMEEQDEGSSVMIDLLPNWYNNKFFGFVMCIVATFEDSNDDRDFFIEWVCEMIDDDGDLHEILCHIDYETNGHPKLDHMFFVTTNRDLFDVDDNGDGSFDIENFSSCQEALFRFSFLDTEMCPLPNCNVTKCGVHLLYSEDVESTKSGGGGDDDVDNSGDQTEFVEGGRHGTSNDYEMDLRPKVDDEHSKCSLFNCFSFLFQGNEVKEMEEKADSMEEIKAIDAMEETATIVVDAEERMELQEEEMDAEMEMEMEMETETETSAVEKDDVAEEMELEEVSRTTRGKRKRRDSGVYCEN